MNIELCAGYGFVHLTPAFTNAVLSILLDTASDTARRLDVPIPMPVRVEHVRGYTIDQQYREVGGSLGLTNGFGIDFRHGHVWRVRVPPVYFDLQTTDVPTFFYGTNNMTTQEAVEEARNSIQKLGYSLEDTFADLDPKITVPYVEPDGRVIPRYMVEWVDPARGGEVVRMEIDSQQRRLAYAAFSTYNLWKPPPPLTIPRPEPSPRDMPFYQPRRNAVSLTYALELLPYLLKAATNAIKRFELPIETPLTTNQIACYRLSSLGWCVKTDLIFTNGAALQFMGTRLTGTRQPDFFFERTREKTHAREFLGVSNITEAEALSFARTQFRTLVGQEALLPVEKEPYSAMKPILVGTNFSIPRILFSWTFRQGESASIEGNARVEVDTQHKRITSISWGSLHYTNDPPVLSIPIEAPLPEGSGDLYLPPLGHRNLLIDEDNTY